MSLARHVTKSLRSAWHFVETFNPTTMPFYAVAKGRKPGIYNTWPECQQQVNGFAGARYKKFPTTKEAQDFINSNNSSSNLRATSPVKATTRLGITTNAQDSQGVPYTISPNDLLDWDLLDSAEEDNSYVPSSSSSSNFDQFKPKSKLYELGKPIKRGATEVIDLVTEENSRKFKRVANSELKTFEKSPCSQHSNSAIVYTDGACTKNGKAGAKAGIGVFWGPGHPNNISERLEGRPTNNRAEIHAAVRAIQQAKDQGYNCITIMTDSKFMLQSMTQWLPKWKRNGWKISDGTEVKNKQDFIDLDRASQGIHVNWVKVAGHRGIEGNEMADYLARNGIKQISSNTYHC